MDINQSTRSPHLGRVGTRQQPEHGANGLPSITGEEAGRTRETSGGGQATSIDQDSQRAESLSAARMMIRDMDPQCSRLLGRIEQLKCGQLYKNDPSLEPTSGAVLGGVLSQNGLKKGTKDFQAAREDRNLSQGGRTD